MPRRLWLILLVTSLLVCCGCSAEKKVSTERTDRFDSVELIPTGSPHISDVQIIPDIENAKVKVVVEIDTPGPAGFEVRFRLREVRTGNTVRSGAIGLAETTADKREPVSFDIPVDDCHLWSPEDPFLYELELWTAGDNVRTRFGMRSFRLDKASDRGI